MGRLSSLGTSLSGASFTDGDGDAASALAGKGAAWLSAAEEGALAEGLCADNARIDAHPAKPAAAIMGPRRLATGLRRPEPEAIVLESSEAIVILAGYLSFAADSRREVLQLAGSEPKGAKARPSSHADA